ncbi:glutathione synthase [Xylariaceae sp. FL0662B]|nr:glutathione synthase [Xylariaceae sp. FL0662B]
MQPADLTEEQLERILFELEDYQISHGSLLKTPRSLLEIESPTAVARPIGVSVVPTPFPSPLFNHALQIQTLFNELYIKVAEDDAWLQAILQELGRTDEFAAKLWSIWERVRDEGEAQLLRCGIFRSDYMLHNDDPEDERVVSNEQVREADRSPQLKQVEFNTYSCAGATHANIVASMHRYLARKGVHQVSHIRPACLPENSSVRSIVAALETAHQAYGPPFDRTRQTAILMTVQPNNVNVCDERPIEYGLIERDPPIMLYRVEFGDEIMKSCSIGPNRELLFRPSTTTEIEISVVYQRAGYDSHEYDTQGVNARYMLEISRAIKCPSILSHITGLKKVQQELTKPGVLERFLSPGKSGILRGTFMSQYPFDSSELGTQARKLASDGDTAENYILKPSLEGGGHNVYDIPGFLRTIPQDQWDRYVLMKKITPPLTHGVLVSPVMAHRGPVISELGTLGTCLWQRNEQYARKVEILSNSGAGWTFKTKPHHVEEMSVVKGYGCFDCPHLIDYNQNLSS